MKTMIRRLGASVLLIAAVLGGGRPARADLVYVATYDNLYGTIDTSTGLFNGIGTTPANYTSLAFAPAGQLYAIADTGAVDLYRINAATGASTLIGDTGLYGKGGTIQSYGFAITPNGTSYAYQSNTSSSTSGIYTIDLNSANSARLGDAGFKSNGGMAADGLGNLYLTQGQGDGNGIYQIDRGTGQGTLLGNSDGGTAYAIAFVGEALYAFTPAGAIDRLDLSDGLSTQVATYDVGAIGVIGGAAAPTVVPEPASLTLLGIGLAALLARARRRRAAGEANSA